MSQDINSHTGTGRLARDAELSYTQKETAILKFSIASNRYKGGEGENKEAVSFFDCQLWGKQAVALSPYLKKGGQIAFEGEWIQERWNDQKTGSVRQKYTINLKKVLLIGKKSEGGQATPQQQNNPQSNENIEFQDFDQNTLGDDEVPF